jgi:hypothetical protein
MGAILGRLVDPVNVTGMADQTGPRRVGGSTVSGFGTNGSGTADEYWAQQAALGQAPHIANSAPKGFLESMGAWNGRLPNSGLEKLAPPPPEHWVYDPKKGASWATPHRKGNSNEFDISHDAPGSEGYNSFKGNRI